MNLNTRGSWQAKRQVNLKIYKLRQSSSLFFYKTTLFLLTCSLLCIIGMWIYAYNLDAIPNAAWGENSGNHGPWRYRYSLRSLGWLVLHMQLFATHLILISFVLNPGRKTIILSAITFVFFFLFMHTHYWLID